MKPAEPYVGPPSDAKLLRSWEGFSTAEIERLCKDVPRGGPDPRWAESMAARRRVLALRQSGAA